MMSSRSAFRKPARGITLIEILVGMAITLIMMAAVVNLFANIGQSVSNRRASMEMNNQLRVVRAQLFNDLAGATCPAETWQRPGNENGYIEIIEGRFSDANPSILLSDNLIDTENGLNTATSLVPSSNNVDPESNQATDGLGLGDHDDILALTVKSIHKPFIGRGQGGNSIRSNYAEIIWYSVENPADGSLGEPGMRTVYRRVLLIAPWVPLPSGLSPNDFFQQVDISARTDGAGNWIPNTLSDLTKRENRFLRVADPTTYPHVMVSAGSNLGTEGTRITASVTGGGTDDLRVDAQVQGIVDENGQVSSYIVTDSGQYDGSGTIPEVSITGYNPNLTPRPVMARIGQVDVDDGTFVEAWGIAHVTNGPAPLAYDRQGQDVMLNDVLAFDLRVFDPGAPVVVHSTGAVLEPSDNGWFAPTIGNDIVAFGAYVDLGWDANVIYDYSSIANDIPSAPMPSFQQARQPGWHPRLPLGFGYGLFPAVYDTWSTHYESDGRDQDNVDNDNDIETGADQGTNGLDDDFVNGVDDPGERETSPPYDAPLRGIQVKFRMYERDTRQIRQATVTKSFVEN